MTTQAITPQKPDLARWALKLGLRLSQLCEPGKRYQVTLTLTGDRQDWTITELGKVEGCTE